MPTIGDKAFIRPAPSHMPTTGTHSMVLADPASGRFLATIGEDVVLSAHHLARIAQGEIEIVPSKEEQAALAAERAKQRASTPAPAKPEEK